MQVLYTLSLYTVSTLEVYVSRTAPDGIEPSNVAVKVLCLTAWRWGNVQFRYRKIVANLITLPPNATRSTYIGIVILCEVSCSLSHHLGATQPHGHGRTRTYDPLINSQMLYQLSYVSELLRSPVRSLLRQFAQCFMHKNETADG